MAKDWVPGEVESSGGGNYLRMKDLDAMPDKTACVRILQPFVGGWELWDKNTKPHRFATKQECEQSGIEPRVEPNKKNPKQFWAAVVWNQDAKRLQVFSFTQSSVFTQLKALAGNKRWGPMDSYDVTIQRKGSGTDTEYTVLPCGKEPLPADAQAAWDAFSAEAVGVDALFHGGDPFAPFGDEKSKETIPF